MTIEQVFGCPHSPAAMMGVICPGTYMEGKEKLLHSDNTEQCVLKGSSSNWHKKIKCL